MTKIPGGYILVARKTLESAVMSMPPLYRSIWLWILLNANYDERNGLKRGQLRASMTDIIKSSSYKSGYRTISPTYKEVRCALEFLRGKSAGQSGGHTEGKAEGNTAGKMITTKSTSDGYIITVEKYDFFQDFKNYGGDNGGQSEGQHGGRAEGKTEGNILRRKQLMKERRGERARVNVNKGARRPVDNSTPPPSQIRGGDQLPKDTLAVADAFISALKLTRLDTAAKREIYARGIAAQCGKLLTLAGGDVELARAAIAAKSAEYRRDGKNWKPDYIVQDFAEWDEKRQRRQETENRRQAEQRRDELEAAERAKQRRAPAAPLPQEWHDLRAKMATAAKLKSFTAVGRA
ncbi:MAG: hypothetical protein PHP45_03470 [Elusimicrobiales bacterium]|nr:hypothetical protein [Elusimicrobiales bacterium]